MSGISVALPSLILRPFSGLQPTTSVTPVADRFIIALALDGVLIWLTYKQSLGRARAVRRGLSSIKSNAERTGVSSAAYGANERERGVRERRARSCGMRISGPETKSGGDA